MSPQPLPITGARRLAGGSAGMLATTSMAAGFAISPMTVLLAVPGEDLDANLPLFGLTLAATLAFILIGHALIRAALGRVRTGGSLSRFFRYQLAAIGVGAGLGLCFAPAMLSAAPGWWAASIIAGITLCLLSLLAFRSARRPILRRSPGPNIGLAEGVVVDYWSGVLPRGAAPQLATIRFVDEAGRTRFARHLIQQRPTVLGTMGQVQYDRRRPHRVLRFSISGPRSPARSRNSSEQRHRPHGARQHTNPCGNQQRMNPHGHLGEDF
ncbi:hypothetical protein [Brevibacterium renqingii]|uniref:hypothetical protein n=1 Tax=Brevibacterium renqingii TaxID=2776916 RepID=UPI001AE02EAC|nr:hypothetical protein [Brevibacterium renqingii]